MLDERGLRVVETSGELPMLQPLDYESERIIQDNMRAICRGRTVIIIAHRLSAVRIAERIVAMDKGRIVEMGSHADLIERDGYYAGMVRMQVA